MNLNIQISAEVESKLQQSATAAGKNLESFVQQLIAERLSEPDLESTAEIKLPTVSEFAKRQEAWVKLHPVLDHPIDDSRESFYVGRE